MQCAIEIQHIRDFGGGGGQGVQVTQALRSQGPPTEAKMGNQKNNICGVRITATSLTSDSAKNFVQCRPSKANTSMTVLAECLARFVNGAEPYRSARPPTPHQKCSGECSERCRPQMGRSGKCSGKCSSLFLEETRGASTFPSTSPSTPFLAGTSPSTLPSTLGSLGVLRFCRGPPRLQSQMPPDTKLLRR